MRLPVRMRRSCRAVTVPASRPAVAPLRTDSANSAHVCTRIFCEHRAIFIERMRRQVEADRVVLAL